jgi:hypothetical protein
MEEIAGHPTVTVGDGDSSLVVIPGLSDAFPGSGKLKSSGGFFAVSVESS